MAMSLRRRLWALERVVVHRDDDRCEACGYGTGAEIEFVVAFADEAIEGPDVCATCGRALVIRLTFDDPLEVGGSSVAPSIARASGDPSAGSCLAPNGSPACDDHGCCRLGTARLGSSPNGEI